MFSVGLSGCVSYLLAAEVEEVLAMEVNMSPREVNFTQMPHSVEKRAFRGLITLPKNINLSPFLLLV